MLKKSPIKAAAANKSSPPKADPAVSGKRAGKRREQTRAIETRLAILAAALAEFAEKGYEGASTRSIADRADVVSPLIAYHYRTKEILWQAVATHYLVTLQDSWDKLAADHSDMSPHERVRREFRTLLEFTLQNPNFHHFMIQENRPGSPRMPWLVKTVLEPLLRRVLPHIAAAQEEGTMPPGPPILLYYMLLGMASVPTTLGEEISLNTDLNLGDTTLWETYFSLIESVVFR